MLYDVLRRWKRVRCRLILARRHHDMAGAESERLYGSADRLYGSVVINGHCHERRPFLAIEFLVR